ncbi:hypothetical protein CEXT_666021 [Caerostris extrusa]|uniref:Uncharacterized protein n=1 Tax=Caerostris extrusa TaxID=172846 RepID=A0AAV4QJ81_CAEEX|nr:hypothetical protein CEXT_666021 [Caerostris extrusa]
MALIKTAVYTDTLRAFRTVAITRDTISAPNNGLITLGKLKLNSQPLRYVVTIHQLRWVYFAELDLNGELSSSLG